MSFYSGRPADRHEVPTCRDQTSCLLLHRKRETTSGRGADGAIPPALSQTLIRYSEWIMRADFIGTATPRTVRAFSRIYTIPDLRTTRGKFFNLIKPAVVSDGEYTGIFSHLVLWLVLFDEEDLVRKKPRRDGKRFLHVLHFVFNVW